MAKFSLLYSTILQEKLVGRRARNVVACSRLGVMV